MSKVPCTRSLAFSVMALSSEAQFILRHILGFKRGRLGGGGEPLLDRLAEVLRGLRRPREVDPGPFCEERPELVVKGPREPRLLQRDPEDPGHLAGPFPGPDTDRKDDQIGAEDLAFPRMNALSYWLYLFSGLSLVGTLFLPGGAPSTGWTLYAPLTSSQFSPQPGMTLGGLAVALLAVSITISSINFITTILRCRTKGMTWKRIPPLLGPRASLC
jgi:hypothetical protein